MSINLHLRVNHIPFSRKLAEGQAASQSLIRNESLPAVEPPQPPLIPLNRKHSLGDRLSPKFLHAGEEVVMLLPDPCLCLFIDMYQLQILTRTDHRTVGSGNRVCCREKSKAILSGRSRPVPSWAPGGHRSLIIRRMLHIPSGNLLSVKCFEQLGTVLKIRYWCKELRRRKWQLTPVFLPGESCGQRSLVGCRCAESHTTEAT